VTGSDLAARLLGHGFDFFTGVPCSLLGNLFAALDSDPAITYVAAVREDAAVGVAAGAWLGGRRPVVLMQNSGLGTSLNTLASLSLMYGLPALLLVTWRGYQGKDAPEHILMGEITPSLLDLLGVPHRVLSRDSIDADLEWAAREFDARCAPVALVVPPGVVGASAGGRVRGPRGEPPPPGVGSPGSPRGPLTLPPAAAALHHSGGRSGEPLVPRISRREAIEAVVTSLADEAVVHANGFICRESFSVADRAENFYMIGSMGLASAIGLGIALARPARGVVILDGDGNLLMNLGVLAMIGAARPARFVHCVFDNEVYGSTGNQASPSRAVRLDALAAAAGYRTSVAVTARADLVEALRAARASEGPHVILAKVTTEEGEVPRIPHAPAAIRDRFRASVGTV
jgi:phosphonopyruvate decarboxylase